MSSKTVGYVLIVVNFVMLIVLVHTFRDVQELKTSDTTAQFALNVSCKRSNVGRGVQVFILRQLRDIATVVAASSQTPEIAAKFATEKPVYERKLENLRVPADQHPQANHPFLVDCDVAWPLKK